MATERFLGGAWATVHGPTDGARLLTWVLERGFVGLMAAPGPRAVDWRAVSAATSDLPASLAGVRANSALEVTPPEHGSLASASASDREPALARLTDAVRLARVVHTPRVVLEPGPVRVHGPEGAVDLGEPGGLDPDAAQAQLARRNAARDAALAELCRALWGLCRAFPDIEFCLTPSRHALSLGDPEALEDVFSDLRSCRLGYWHDTAIAARRHELFGTHQGSWLESFGNQLSGMTLGDSVDGSLYLPPGAGGVDYPLLASYRRRSGRPVPAVIELDPGVEPAEIPGVHAFLSKFGL